MHQLYAESMPLSRQLSCSDPLGHKPKVAWPFQASFSCQEPFHSLLLFLNLLSPRDPFKTALWNPPERTEYRFPPRRSYVSLTSACSLPAQLAFLGPPDILRARRGRQVALPEPRARSRCRRPGKSESGSPGSVAAKRSVRAIPELAERPRAARTAQRSSFPHFPDATRWSLQACPSLARLSLACLSLVRVSPDFSRDLGLPPPAPRPATSRKRRRWCRPPHFPTPRGFRGPPAQWPPTQGRKRAPENSGSYSPRSLSRLPQGAHGHRRAPGAASPGATRRLGGMQLIATAAAACQALRPRPLHLRTAHPPLSSRASPLAAHPQAQTLCARTLSLSPARARALTIACTNHLTHTLMLSAVGSVWRSSAALL